MKALVTGASSSIESYIANKLEKNYKDIGIDLWFNKIDVTYRVGNSNFEFVKRNILTKNILSC